MESSPAAKKIKKWVGEPSLKGNKAGRQTRKGGYEPGASCQGHPGVGEPVGCCIEVKQVSPGSSRCGFDLWAYLGGERFPQGGNTLWGADLFARFGSARFHIS